MRRTSLSNTETDTLRFGPALHNGQPTSDETTTGNRKVTYKVTCKFCNSTKEMAKPSAVKYVCRCQLPRNRAPDLNLPTRAPDLQTKATVFKVGDNLFKVVMGTFDSAMKTLDSQTISGWYAAGLKAHEVNVNGSRATLTLTIT